MQIRIGSPAPDFVAETTMGPIHFHDWIGDGWCILFSHPKDFTPVCTTELGRMATLEETFSARDCKIIGLGADPLESHLDWADDIAEVCGRAPGYPVIADTDLEVSKLYGMLPADEIADGSPRTVAQNATIRSVFLIDPKKTVRLIMAYPYTCGRNFDEVLRALDSLRLTDRHDLSTPADWTNGDDVLLPGWMTDEEARAIYPAGWRAPKPYVRFVAQP